MKDEDIYDALREFVSCINATGGVQVIKQGQSSEVGLHVPVADPDWIDLGEAYMQACEALDVAPQVQP